MSNQARIRVVGAVALEAERVFLARRPPGAEHGGLWEFPGGKVEPGESDEEALSRELSEELSLSVEVGSHFLTTRDERIELVCYRVRFLTRPHATEVEEMAWFTCGDLSELPLPPADLPVMAQVIRELQGV